MRKREHITYMTWGMNLLGAYRNLPGIVKDGSGREFAVLWVLGGTLVKAS
jgi:hypothetical protein